MLKGVNASEGIGIGKVMLIEEVSLDYEKKQITDTQAEIDRYRKVLTHIVKKQKNKLKTLRTLLVKRKQILFLVTYLC